MTLRSLVSFGLFLLPIAVTLGILFGIDGSRHSTGQKSIFAPAPVTKITTDTFCQLTYGFTPDPGRYTFNPNQWGVTSGTGNLCMNVTFWENGTYPTNATSPAFTASWSYDQGSEAQPVHAFPNAKIEIAEITNTTTVLLSNLSSIPVGLSWTYGGGNTSAATLDASALDTANMNANICFDMFLDSDATTAVNTTDAAYEVMIWFGNYGLSTQPIGNTDGVVTTLAINGTTFDLYSGENSNTDQKVFTWLTSTNTTDFTGDIAPLITELSSYSGPVSTDHLGYIAFGSEALYATSAVTFTVSELSIDLVTQ